MSIDNTKDPFFETVVLSGNGLYDFSPFLEMGDDCMIITNAVGDILAANAHTFDLLGYSPEELHDTNINTYVYSIDKKIGEGITFTKEKRIRVFEITLTTRFGVRIYFSCRIRYLPQEGYFYLLFHDITAQRAHFQRIIQNEERILILINNINEYLYSVKFKDGSFIDTFHNKRSEDVTGYKPQEFMDDPDLWYKMIYPEDRELVLENLERLQAAKGSFEIEHRIIHKDGSIRWITNSCVAVVNEFEKLHEYIGFIIDITDKKQKEEELYVIATTDPLTGTTNRRAGMTLLDQCIKRSRRVREYLTIVFIDINNLKQVNDEQGHQMGDQLIIAVARIMQQQLRQTDTLCRVGGDEYILILENTNLKESKIFMKRIIESVILYNKNSNKPFRVHISYGFAEFNPEQFTSVDSLIETADKEMYFYKKKSKVGRDFI